MGSRRISRRSNSDGFSLDRLLATPPPEGPPPPAPALEAIALTRDCRGLEWEGLLGLVADSIADEDKELLDRILELVDEAGRLPRLDPGTQEVLRGEGGEILYQQHAFVDWCWGLDSGAFRLPAVMPRGVAEGFLEYPPAGPWLLRRCEGCLAWLPNRFQLSWPCPVCGGADISHKKISGPPWDPMWVYTPRPRKG
jgi:hypothetical protein